MHRSKVLPPRGATKEFEPIARNRFDYRWGISFLRFTNHYCVDELLFCRRHIAGRSESNGCRAVIGRLAYLDQRPCSRLAEEQDQLETRSADWAGGGGWGGGEEEHYYTSSPVYRQPPALLQSPQFQSLDKRQNHRIRINTEAKAKVGGQNLFDSLPR